VRIWRAVFRLSGNRWKQFQLFPAWLPDAPPATRHYLSRQGLKIAELQDEIEDLTAAQTIDAATLGADYIAIAQIQGDESTQANQLTTIIRGVLTDAQQPQLQALDNALQLGFTATEAVSADIWRCRRIFRCRQVATL